MNDGPLCECGCGDRITLKQHHKYVGVPRFIPGHQARTKHLRDAVNASVKVSTDEIPPPNPSGICMCGCGQPTAVATRSSRRRGQVVGHHLRYLPGHSKRKTGADNANWKGGRTIRRGYVMLLMPEHPRADSKGYIPEHQVVAEGEMGRLLRPGELVHHVNGIKDDNRPDNLIVMGTREHMEIHREERVEAIRRYHETHPEFASRIGQLGAEARWGT